MPKGIGYRTAGKLLSDSEAKANPNMSRRRVKKRKKKKSGTAVGIVKEQIKSRGDRIDEALRKSDAGGKKKGNK